MRIMTISAFMDIFAKYFRVNRNVHKNIGGCVQICKINWRLFWFSQKFCKNVCLRKNICRIVCLKKENSTGMSLSKLSPSAV